MPDQKRHRMRQGMRRGSAPANSCPLFDFTVALAGNANVGKSATINQLTGAEQATGNWPGKTVAAYTKDKGERFSKEAAMAKLFSSETAMARASPATEPRGSSDR